VVKEGRISQNQTLTKPFGGAFLVGASLEPKLKCISKYEVGVSLPHSYSGRWFDPSWAHSKSRSYNLKNCNFFFGASLVPGFEIKWGVLTEKI
jgi:hypothetical protein